MTIFDKINQKTNEAFYRDWQTKLAASEKHKRYARFFGITVIYGYIGFGLILLILPWTRSQAFFAFVSFAFAWVILVKFVSFLYQVPRPYQKYKFSPVATGLFSKIDSVPDSFPSGHLASLAAISSAFLLTFTIPGLVLGVISACLTAAAARARMVLGYHFMVDVLAGVLFGIIAALIFWPTLG